MATQSLADFFGVDKVDFKLVEPQRLLRQTAHLVIDVQKLFVHRRRYGHERSENMAKQIGKLTPEFTNAGIEPYWIYFGRNPLLHKWLDRPGFYGAKPKFGQKIIRKFHDSAFAGSNIDQILRKDGIKNLLISGFNTSACVNLTAVDAMDHGYQVCLLEDMTANGAMPAWEAATLYQLEEKGAIVADSACVLEYIKDMKP